MSDIAAGAAQAPTTTAQGTEATDTQTKTTAPETSAAETPSPAVDAAPDKAEPEDKFAPRFAKLSKMEQRIRREREEFKRERERFEAELSPFREAAEALKKGSPKDKLAALERLGMTYRDLTAAALTQGDEDPVAPVKSELERLKQQLEEEKAQAQRAKVEQQIAEFQAHVRTTVQSGAEKWPALNALGYADQVFAHIQQHARDTAASGEPELLSVEDAADAIEAQLDAAFEALIALPKYAAKAKPPTPQTGQQATEAAKPTPSDGPRTLTNGHAAERASNGASRHLSPKEAERERIRRAVAQLK